MTHDEIDRILSREEEVLPSSGFSASVMEAVRREAALPPPIPFPWTRALPGLLVAALALVAVGLVFAAGLAQSLREGGGAPLAGRWQSAVTAILNGAATPTVGWTCAVLFLTWVSVTFSLRLAGSRR